LEKTGRRQQRNIAGVRELDFVASFVFSQKLKPGIEVVVGCSHPEFSGAIFQCLCL
jgi:hypothetical protein